MLHEGRLSTAPRTHVLTRALAGMPGGRLLLGTGAAVLILAVLAALNVAGEARLWGNAHWTLAGVTATVVAWMGYAHADASARKVRFWASVALTMWSAGQLIWVAETSQGRPFPAGLPDVLWLTAFIPVLFGFRASFTSRVRRARELAVYLDSLAALGAIVAVTLVVLAGRAAQVGGTAGLLIVLYPALYFGIAAAFVMSALSNRRQLAAPSSYAVVAGVVLLGVIQTVWASARADAVPDGLVMKLVASGAVILLGFGAAAWSDRHAPTGRQERLAWFLQAAIPIASVVVVAAMAVLSGLVSRGPADFAIDLCVVAVLILTAIRQTLLLRDRASMVDELRTTHDKLVIALDHAEEAERAQRVVAEQRGRALAASEHLQAPGSAVAVLRSVLGLLLPDGTVGFVARWAHDGSSVAIIAAHGLGSGGLEGRSIEIAHLDPSIAAMRVDGQPRAFAARGAESVPVGLLAQSVYAYTRVVATAGASLTLLFKARDGKPLGSLNLIDPDPVGERFLEPDFIAFARMVSNQIGVALENMDLVERLRAQIDEIGRVQAQLVQASRLSAIGELAAAVAHEVNNPLTGVLGYADLLLTETTPDDPAREGLLVIRDEAIRARTVIRALLDFARPRPPERHSVSLADVAGSTLDLMRYHLGSHGVTIVEHYADLPLLDLDESAMRQVLLNLISNAEQALPTGGTLTVSTDRRDEDVVISVADDGTGMSDEVRARIFEPFFSTRPMSPGRGLGLSISLGLVESHGGSIRVASVEGGGTTVEVTLPMAVSSPELLDAVLAGSSSQ